MPQARAHLCHVLVAEAIATPALAGPARAAGMAHVHDADADADGFTDARFGRIAPHRTQAPLKARLARLAAHLPDGQRDAMIRA